MGGLRHGFERLVCALVAFALTSEPSIAILCVEAARSAFAVAIGTRPSALSPAA
jgi:hypothetical protein